MSYYLVFKEGSQKEKGKRVLLGHGGIGLPSGSIAGFNEARGYSIEDSILMRGQGIVSTFVDDINPALQTMEIMAYSLLWVMQDSDQP